MRIGITFGLMTSLIKGDKMKLRKEPRTYITGLSLSNGEVVSSHKVLHQKTVGLDTIIFDTKNKKASVVFHQDIDVELEKSKIF